MPVVDAAHAVEPFVPGEPLELVQAGLFNKMPIIFGTCRNEGEITFFCYLDLKIRPSL
jgi:hypothetical protein